METLADDYDKKKLQSLLKDILKIGCIKGFRFFSMYLRGREELLLKVQNEQLISHPITQRFDQGDVHSSKSNPQVITCGDGVVVDSYDDYVEDDIDEQSRSHDHKPLPRPYDSLMLSKSTQRSLSGFHFLDIGLPPASPCETDAESAEHSSTLFLIAAYARYKNPYVWVRSNHHRLVQFAECHTSDDDVYQIQDSPLKLKSTSDWRHKDLKLWHILAEVIRINVMPSPRNPFEVDHSYFDELSTEECLLATGAMIHFLQRVLMHGEHSYHTKVSQDLNELMLKNFKAMQMIVEQNPCAFQPHVSMLSTGQQNTPIYPY